VATADTASSIVITKQIPWMGGTRTYTNRYHVTGPLTIGTTPFGTLADAIVADEAAALSDNSVIVQADWADASTASSTNPHGDVTQTKTYSQNGALSPDGTHPRCPVEVAVFIRYSTTQRSVKNHPIYLGNYYHDIIRSDTDQNQVSTTMLGALQEYATDWLAGYSDGTNTRVRCGPRGAVAQAAAVSPFLTHRDFPR